MPVFALENWKAVKNPDCSVTFTTFQSQYNQISGFEVYAMVRDLKLKKDVRTKVTTRESLIKKKKKDDRYETEEPLYYAHTLTVKSLRNAPEVGGWTTVANTTVGGKKVSYIITVGSRNKLQLENEVEVTQSDDEIAYIFDPSKPYVAPVVEKECDDVDDAQTVEEVAVPEAKSSWADDD